MSLSVDRQTLLSGVERPPEHLALDARSLGHYLQGRVDSLGPNFTVEKFKGGQSNPTYKLSGDRTYVLRRRPPGKLLASAHAIDREYRVMSALWTAGYPVPQPFLYCDDETVIGSSFYVVGFSPGTVFWNADLPGLVPDSRAAIYADMNARLAELHTLDPAALGLDDFGSASGYTARNLARWSKIYDQSRFADVPDMDWLMATLPEFLPPEQPARLLHGDYTLYNVIIETRHPAIAAVLDWEMSTLGDPFVDLAHHLRHWWEPADPHGASPSLQGRDLTALGIPTMDAYIDAYCHALDVPELPYRRFYLAFAQFRFAAMIQGILKRAAIGTNANPTLHRQDRVAAAAALARATFEGRDP